MKVDLITGFLGAGKTTFIRKYIAYLKTIGINVLLIENEFGMASIDTRLLSDADIPMQDLTGTCMCCSGKEMFINMLLDAAAQGFDRVVIEPSGIYDVDEFFSVMTMSSVKKCCQIGNIITIVDAKWNAHITDDAAYLLFSQLQPAGSVLISKSQLFSAEELEETIQKMNTLLINHGCSPLSREKVNTQNWEYFDTNDFEKMLTSGWSFEEHTRSASDHETLFKALPFIGFCKDEATLRETLSDIYSQPDRYGVIFRIKGHFKCDDGTFLEVNTTEHVFSIKPVKIKRGMAVVIGENISEEKLAMLGKF